MDASIAGFLRYDLWEISKNRNEWPLLGEGIRIKLLQEGPELGESMALLAYIPGAKVPAHKHIGAETIIILEGSQTDESGTYGPGCLLFNPKDSIHSVQSNYGCLVLIHWKAPVQFINPSEPF